jgi:hypothetical protein
MKWHIICKSVIGPCVKLSEQAGLLVGLCKMIPEQVTKEHKFSAWISASTFSIAINCYDF